MTLSGTTYIATAIGFTPGQDEGTFGDATMSITTTNNAQVMSTGDINFQRAFVETSQNETVIVDNGKFQIDIPNLDTLPTDAYLLVMSTHAAPGPLPIGYKLASSTYNVSPSGALTQSEKLMILNFNFEDSLPGSSDPHILAISN